MTWNKRLLYRNLFRESVRLFHLIIKFIAMGMYKQYMSNVLVCLRFKPDIFKEFRIIIFVLFLLLLYVTC